MRTLASFSFFLLLSIFTRLYFLPHICRYHIILASASPEIIVTG